MSKGPPSFSFSTSREEHLPFASKWGFERGCQEGRERLSDLHRSPLISTDEMVTHYTEVK